MYLKHGWPLFRIEGVPNNFASSNVDLVRTEIFGSPGGKRRAPERVTQTNSKFGFST